MSLTYTCDVCKKESTVGFEQRLRFVLLREGAKQNDGEFYDLQWEIVPGARKYSRVEHVCVSCVLKRLAERLSVDELRSVIEEKSRE